MSVLPHAQLINMCSSDGQRMFDAAAVGSLLAGGPLLAVLGVAYNLYILGPTSLLGSAVFILFYPTMVSPRLPTQQGRSRKRSIILFLVLALESDPLC